MLFSRKLTAVSLITLVGLAVSPACSSGDESGADGTGANGTGANGTGANGTGNNGSGANGSGGDNGSGNSSSGGTINTGDGGGSYIGEGGSAAGPTLTPDGEAICGDVACECSDGEDNDGDGEVDGFDVECQGPLDNDEGSFATGIPGDNRDESWVDCFFDGDSGSGNDRCKYPYECLTGEIDVDDPDCAGAASEACINFCAPRTPNGCDCFGCCTITVEGSDPVNILTIPGCSLDNIDDTDACPRCDQTTSCQNECGECELCPGKTEEDLPESCTPDPPPGGAPSDPPPTYECEGADVCTDTLPCDSGYYCSLGCCIPVIK